MKLLKYLLASIHKIKNITGYVSESDRIRSELLEAQDELNKLKVQLDELYVPPGHFFSPLPSLDEIRSEESRIFGEVPDKINAVDLNAIGQLELFQKLASYYEELPFHEAQSSNFRYYLDNAAYSYGDGIFSFCMLRHISPKRIIEVGSGYSSCLILDTNELFFDGAIQTIFIEPYPKLLMSLITEDDLSSIELVPERLQDVETSVFESLEPGDVLFIDSTHVSKIGSDVNHLFFEVLPRLQSGVFVHLHDIFYPFEYPKWWVYEGRGWNEAYLLRAFLQYNNQFRIVLMNTYMRKFHEGLIEAHMPLCLKQMGGSIWIQKS